MIASAHAGGRLLALLAGEAFAFFERDAAFALVMLMHEAGEIDAIGALLDPGAEWGRTPEWLARQQVLTVLIPRLTALVERMMSVIGAVREQMVQHVLEDACLLWCEIDPRRAAEVIASVDRGMCVTTFKLAT